MGWPASLRNAELGVVGVEGLRLGFGVQGLELRLEKRAAKPINLGPNTL